MTAPETALSGTGSATPANGRSWAATAKARESGILLALLALVAFTATQNPRFLSGQSIRDVLLGAALLAVLAVGESIVMITRNVDLSVGSVLGLSAFAVGSLLQAHPGLPVLAALLVGVAVGALCGLVNGALVRFGQVPALVVTLGTMYVYRGLAFFWAGGRQVNADELPRAFLAFGGSSLLAVPWLVIIALLVVLAASVALRSYPVGRELYAMGSSPQAARLAGVRMGGNISGVFLTSGALAGLAGVMFASRFGTVDAAAGTGYELNVVAAAVVGGVAVFGGSGTAWGASLGAVLMTVIGSSLAVLDIDQFWQQAIVGALILLAIGADRLAARTAEGRGATHA